MLTNAIKLDYITIVNVFGFAVDLEITKTGDVYEE
jgi:hypothetical protein